MNGIELCAPKKGLDFIQSQFYKLGWGSSIPHDEQAKNAYLDDIFQALTYDNPYCLREVPYAITLKLFFKDLTRGVMDKKPFPNMADIMYSFKEWQASNRVKVRKEHLRVEGGEYDDINALFAKYTPKND